MEPVEALRLAANQFEDGRITDEVRRDEYRGFRASMRLTQFFVTYGFEEQGKLLIVRFLVIRLSRQAQPESTIQSRYGCVASPDFELVSRRQSAVWRRRTGDRKPDKPHRTRKLGSSTGLRSQSRGKDGGPSFGEPSVALP